MNRPDEHTGERSFVFSEKARTPTRALQVPVKLRCRGQMPAQASAARAGSASRGEKSA